MALKRNARTATRRVTFEHETPICIASRAGNLHLVLGPRNLNDSRQKNEPDHDEKGRRSMLGRLFISHFGSEQSSARMFARIAGNARDLQPTITTIESRSTFSGFAIYATRSAIADHPCCPWVWAVEFKRV